MNLAHLSLLTSKFGNKMAGKVVSYETGRGYTLELWVNNQFKEFNDYDEYVEAQKEAM